MAAAPEEELRSVRAAAPPLLQCPEHLEGGSSDNYSGHGDLIRAGSRLLCQSHSFQVHCLASLGFSHRIPGKSGSAAFNFFGTLCRFYVAAVALGWSFFIIQPLGVAFLATGMKNILGALEFFHRKGIVMA